MSVPRICGACRRLQALTEVKSKNLRKPATVSARREISTTARRNQDIPSQEYLAANTQPRWKQTPKGMTMPFRLRPKILNNEWTCNDSPERLDAMYKKLLGPDGPQMLTEETKWLAITHKSFDQGRRGFNERLGYMGRRIVELQASLGFLQTVTAPLQATQVDEYGRIPFVHPALQGLGGLTEAGKRTLLTKERLAGLADQYGITRVMRWKPKKADNLLGSGMQIIQAQAIYAIVGAIALERGGEAANQLVRSKILLPLGLRISETES